MSFIFIKPDQFVCKFEKSYKEAGQHGLDTKIQFGEPLVNYLKLKCYELGEAGWWRRKR